MRHVSRSSIAALALAVSLQVSHLEGDVVSAQTDSATNNHKATVGTTIEMQTKSEGVDFESFLQSVRRSVQRDLFGHVPAAIEKGDPATVTVDFRILQNGQLAEGSVKVVSSLGNKEFEHASVNAVRDTTQFDNFPTGASQHSVDIRMIFYFNTPFPSKNR